MDIDITEFVKQEDFMRYSASVMELGANAGPRTWNNAKKAYETWNFLDTPEKQEAFKEYIKGYGAWSEEEVATWSDAELNALFIQFVSGDLREMGIDDVEYEDIDWAEIRKAQESGYMPSNIWKNDGEPGIFFSLGL